MHASITIGGIEVALTTPPGALEKTVATRYAAFLGAVEAPVCSLLLEANRSDLATAGPVRMFVERVGETRYQITHPGLFGLLDLAGTGVVDVASAHPDAVDHALRHLFGLLAPGHDSLTLHGRTVMSGGRANVIIEPAATSRPYAGQHLTGGIVLVRRESEGWLAAQTPFGAHSETFSLPKEGRLNHVSGPSLNDVDPHESAHPAAAAWRVTQGIFLPIAEPGLRQLASSLAAQLLAEVPFSDGRLADRPEMNAAIV